MKPRLFVLSELYYPDDSATGYVLTRIAEGLAQSIEVHVLCGHIAPRDRGEQKLVKEERRGVTIRRCSRTFFDKDIVLLRFINILTVSLSILLRSLFALRKGDVVLVVTNPPLLPFVGLLAARACRSHCVLLIHDVYPEVITATGLLRKGSLIAGGLGWLNAALCRGFERVVVLGRDMKRLIDSKLGAETQRVTIITNWADSDVIAPQSREANQLLQQLGVGGKFVVQYSGNMGRTHGLEVVLEAAAHLAGNGRTHFLMIGTGAKRRGVEAFLASSQISNVTLLPTQPRETLVDTLNACDVAIISFVKGIAGISVPSRMYNIMAAGKPIVAVADEDSELAMVVKEEEIGWVVPPGDAAELCEVIAKAQLMPKVLEDMGRRAREAALRYSFDGVLASYRTLIEDLLKDGTGVGSKNMEQAQHD